MFNPFRSFEQVYPPHAGATSQHMPIRHRKTLKERFVFWMANLFLMPIVAMCYLAIGAEGLRQLMPVFQMKIWKLPIPGAGLMQQYDGFDRADLGMVFALLLFVATTFVWIRLFKEVHGFGTIAQRRTQNPPLFFLLAAVAIIVLVGDAGIFYIGLEAKTANSWTQTPAYVPVAATAVYLAGLALIGAWHADYHCSGVI